MIGLGFSINMTGAPDKDTLIANVKLATAQIEKAHSDYMDNVEKVHGATAKKIVEHLFTTVMFIESLGKALSIEETSPQIQEIVFDMTTGYTHNSILELMLALGEDPNTVGKYTPMATELKTIIGNIITTLEQGAQNDTTKH